MPVDLAALPVGITALLPKVAYTRWRKACGEGGKLGGRPPKVIAPAMIAEVVADLAAGRTQGAVAASKGLSRHAVGRVAKANPDRIQAMRDAIQATVLDVSVERAEGVQTAMADDAQNPESRTKAQAARTFFEATGIIGKGGGNVYGDVNISNTSVDLGQHIHLEYDEELAEKLRKKILGG